MVHRVPIDLQELSVTTSPPQPPQNPYSGQPAGYGPPPQQFPQYTQQPQQPYGGQPGPPYPGQQQGQYPGQPSQQFQQGPQAQSFPQQGFAPQGQMVCRFCGGYPAVDATVRGHQGLVILMRFLKLQGPFCRTCGTASVRDMTAKSLWQGWWGIGSAIVNPITMLMNIGPMQQFKNLPEPTPGPGRPMNPGKPLFQRPAILGLLLPVALIGLIVFANLNSTEAKAKVGACVVNEGSSTNPDVKVVDCASTEAEYKIVDKIDDTTDDSQCSDTAEASYVYQNRSTKYVLCLTPVR
jgi:hypothetical protein